MTHGEQAESPGRILLVEDDPVAAHFTKHVLGKRGGFDVTHTPDPAAALKRITSQTWDLVLTDAELPGMTGLELLEALRRVAPALPVAVISAHDPGDTAVRALRRAADEFLQKPVRPEHLLATVTALVAKGRAARMAARQVVLAIGAHPGDAEIGSAGALLAHRAMGHEVSILTLARGAGSGTQDTRAGESEMAALVLGATLFLEDLPDTLIEAGEPTIGVIAGAVKSVRPTLIYTHSPHDAQADHRHTHRAVMQAAGEISHVLCFQSPSATVDFRPSRFVNIDRQLERKILAIRAFGSRAEVRGYLERDLVESSAGYWSRFGDGRYAEAFEVAGDFGVAGDAAEAVEVAGDAAVPHARPASPAAVRPVRGGTSVSP
jgi:LmbE family N-acetylglucosaminyl deacetylase/CheY-like chemotaxis protein